MGYLITFSPWIAFALLTAQFSTATCAWIALAVALATSLPGWRRSGPKILEVGGVVFFLAIGIAASLAPGAIGLVMARFISDTALCLIVVATIVAGRPFTLAYAKERVPPELWDHPVFLATNQKISGVWAIAFAVMAAAAGARLLWPAVPGWSVAAAVIVMLAVAVGFTVWYPETVRRRFAPPQVAP